MVPRRLLGTLRHVVLLCGSGGALFFVRLYFGGGDDNGDDVALLVDYCIIYCARVCASRAWACSAGLVLILVFGSVCWLLLTILLSRSAAAAVRLQCV